VVVQLLLVLALLVLALLVALLPPWPQSSYLWEQSRLLH
jgi:hypothetical protein